MDVSQPDIHASGLLFLLYSIVTAKQSYVNQQAVKAISRRNPRTSNTLQRKDSGS